MPGRPYFTVQNSVYCWPSGACWAAGQWGAERPVMCGAGLRVRCWGGCFCGGAGRVGRGKVVWGLDVARFGNDRTALCRRRSNVVTHKVLIWRNKDTMQVAGIIGRMFDELDSFEQPSTIVVDVIGIGSGVVDRMAELGLPVIGINVSESPAIGEKFSRLRDELWWRAREWFEAMNCALPDDETLMGELATVRQHPWSSTRSNRPLTGSSAQSAAPGWTTRYCRGRRTTRQSRIPPA